MSAAKKRKLDDEGRVFNSEWCAKYFVVPHKQGAVCLVVLLQSLKSMMLNVITQVSTPPSLIKLLTRHEWTKSNI